MEGNRIRATKTIRVYISELWGRTSRLWGVAQTKRGLSPFFNLTTLTFTAIQASQTSVHDDAGFGVALVAE